MAAFKFFRLVRVQRQGGLPLSFFGSVETMGGKTVTLLFKAFQKWIIKCFLIPFLSRSLLLSPHLSCAAQRYLVNFIAIFRYTPLNYSKHNKIKVPSVLSEFVLCSFFKLKKSCRNGLGLFFCFHNFLVTDKIVRSFLAHCSQLLRKKSAVILKEF